MMGITFTTPERRSLLVLSSRLIIAGAVLTQVACGDDEQQWTEEVQLQSGHIVTVEQRIEGQRSLQFGGPKGWKRKEITLMAKRVPSQIPRPPDWKGLYQPILLDYSQEDEAWILVVTTNFCAQWYALGRPQPPYIEYQSGIDGWRQTSLQSQWIGRESNLMVAPPQSDHDGIAALSPKKNEMRRYDLKYRIVLSKWGRKEGNPCAMNKGGQVHFPLAINERDPFSAERRFGFAWTVKRDPRKITLTHAFTPHETRLIGQEKIEIKAWT